MEKERKQIIFTEDQKQHKAYCLIHAEMWEGELGRKKMPDKSADFRAGIAHFHRVMGEIHGDADRSDEEAAAMFGPDGKSRDFYDGVFLAMSNFPATTINEAIEASQRMFKST